MKVLIWTFSSSEARIRWQGPYQSVRLEEKLHMTGAVPVESAVQERCTIRPEASA